MYPNMKLTPEQKELAFARIQDPKVPKKQKEKDYSDMLDTLLNPKETFDPETFDPFYDDLPEYDVVRRPRELPPRRLPTMGLKPKRLLSGQLIGEFESKQDLYLLIALLSERVSDLEDQLNQK